MPKLLCCGESEKRKSWERKGLNCFPLPSVKGQTSKGIAERHNCRNVLVIKRCFD